MPESSVTSEQKQQTRQRVLAAAAQLFRAHGYNGVSIDRIMAEAGLTRGGFYAHFKSKRNLFAAVMAREHGFTRVLKRLREENGEQTVFDAMDFYLGMENLDEISRDCPSAALSADVRRVGGEVLQANTRTLGDLIDEFERHAGQAPHSRERGAAALALCIGGAVLAGAMEKGALADELLKAVRDHAKSVIVGA